MINILQTTIPTWALYVYIQITYVKKLAFLQGQL